MIKRYTIPILFLVLFCNVQVYAQNLLDIADTLAINKDSIPELSDSLLLMPLDEIADTVSKNAVRKPIFDSPIQYDCADSMAFSFEDGSQVAYLYSNAKITYGDIELTAGEIRIYLQKKEIYAQGLTDSTGVISQKPHFKQGTEEFDCSALRYNFETGKGYVENVVTKQQDGVVHSARAKMMSKDVFCMEDGKYSTCDAEHPHFYLHMTKGKVVGKKAIITGRSYLVLEDFPIYVPFLPYGYIPTGKTSYTSGVIIPSYGEESVYGFYLKDGGFYWAATDYFDLTMKGDIYTKGSWALKTSSNYRLRYKFSGNLGFNISRHITGEQGIDQKKSKNFAINWSHNQDSKANPSRTVSANVNFSTSGYDKLNEFTDYNRAMTNSKSSSVSYMKTFQNTPFKISANMRASQNTADSSVNLSLPNITLNMRTIEPFKRKKQVGDKRFYEDITFGYSADFKNSITAKEYDLFTTPLSQWQKGLKHNFSIGLPSFKLLNYINFSPSVSYNETWYFDYIQKHWVDGYHLYDEENILKWVPGHVEEVRNDGFKRAYEYSFGISAGTTLYGMYQMKNPKSKIKGVRHTMVPNIGLSYHPDFMSNPRFYDWVQVDSLGTLAQYSYFDRSINRYYGGPMSGSINFGLNNNLEMKLANPRDTTKADATRKVSILDNLGFSGSYNLAADSMKLSIISWNLRTKISGFNLNVAGSLDPYAVDERGRRINKYMWNEATGLSRLGRISRAGTGFSYSFSSDKIRKKIEDKTKDKKAPPAAVPTNIDNSDNESGSIERNVDALSEEEEKPSTGYEEFKMPWQFNFNYTLNYTNDGLKPQFVQTLSFNGNIDITNKWKANFNSGFNFKTRKLNSFQMGVTRNLHCWNMSFQFSPIGEIKFYTFMLSANASMLKDLKIDKTSRDY